MSSYKGTNLQRVPESDYSVTVGGLLCTELDVSEDETALTCLPPQSVSAFGQANLAVTVSMFVLIAVHCFARHSECRGYLHTPVKSTQGNHPHEEKPNTPLITVN